MTSAAFTFSDYWRVVTIVLCIIVCALLPLAIGVRGRPVRIWLLLAAVEAFIFSGLVSMGRHIGAGPVVWYRTPLIFFACLLGIAYMAGSYLAWHHHKKGARK